METLTKMKPETVEALQELIAVNTDSVKGFTQAAEKVNDPSLKRLFTEFGRERERFANELSTYVRWNGEEPEDDGSFRAKMHRWWISFRALAEQGDAHALLQEAERGEDAIKDRYEKVLPEVPGNPASATLHTQYQAICRGHDRIRNLRDATA